MTLDVAGATNQKMILTNIVQVAILYLRMKYQHVLKKFPSPNEHVPLRTRYHNYIEIIL